MCVFVCVWRIKVLLLFFPPFAKMKEQNRRKKKKIFVRWKKNMKKNWHTLFFICSI